MKSLSLFTLFLLISFLYFGCKEEETPNSLPYCTIHIPSDGEVLKYGEPVDIRISAKDNDGEIHEARFYIDGEFLISSNEYPYKVTWNTIDEESGNHRVKIVAEDDAGGTSEDEISIELFASAPESNFSANTTKIGEREYLYFTDESTGFPDSWEWHFGDGEISTEQNPKHIYSAITSGEELEQSFTVFLITTNKWGVDTLVKTDYIKVKDKDLTGREGTLKDYNQNTYKWVGIGEQIWMAENLKTTKFPDGTKITLVTDSLAWNNLEDNKKYEAFCYNSINSEEDTYGALYTNSAAQKACPSGWHLPSDDEWKKLKDLVGKSSDLKATVGWNGRLNGTDVYGFCALPGGYRFITGEFVPTGGVAFFWSSTSFKWDTPVAYMINNGFYINNFNRYSGLSVRCVKD